MNRLHVHLPEKDLKELRKRAAKEGIPMSELIRRALHAYFTK